MIKKISLIIPVYNEEKYLSILLGKVQKAPVLNLQKEIIVVNDGSKDCTSDILEKWSKKKIKHFFVINRKKNSGKGKALKIGFQKATGDILLIQDSDLEYDPQNYPDLLKPFLKNNARAVYGSRTLGIGKYGNHYSSLFFLLGGQVLTLLMNLLFKQNLTDQPTGYKLVDKKLARLISKKAREKDFSFEIEMTALIAKNKIKIHEVPIRYSPRSITEGKKINFRDFLKSVYIALKYFFTTYS